MDFSLSDDQRLMRETAQRFFARAENAGDWDQLASLGLAGLAISEENGGAGQGAVEAAFVMEEIGRSLAHLPYLSSAVLGATLLASADDAQARALLPAIADGSQRMTFAHSEPGRRYANTLAVTARKSGAGYVLDGRKTHVLDGAEADLLIVSAAAEDGEALFLVAGDAKGMSVRRYAALDGRPLADLDLSGVEVPASARLASSGGARMHIDAAEDAASAALVAEAVGAMEGALALTSEHLKTRKQFNTQLSKFQVIQHRLVDMKMAIEETRSMAGLAAMAVAENDPRRRAFVSAAKVIAARAGRKVGEQAIQLHGAMGMSDECKAGHFARRLIVIDKLMGDAAHHLQRFASAA